MTEWLDLMLEEIGRKQREKKDAEEEQALRSMEKTEKLPDDKGQSK